MTRTASLKAFAKLNLGLRVLYKRPDGYHELRTIFQTISLADSLDVSFTPSRKSSIRLEATPEIADNLVEKSARILMETLKISGSTIFRLRKYIPAGAGLGGGSSDAAAVLLSLPVLAGKRVAVENLLEIAGKLGSDVPFFLRGGTALGLGRGEELYPLPDANAPFVLLVSPPVHSSTVEAYRDLSETLTSESARTKLSAFQNQTWEGVPEDPANDFEGVIFARYPELARLRKKLLKLGARAALMTGSGSSIFGVFNTSQALSKASQEFPECKVSKVSFVSRARYQSSVIRALQPHVKGNQWPPLSLYAR